MAIDFYQLRVQGLHETEYNECVMHFRGTNLTAADYMDNARDLVNSWVSEIHPAWLDLFPSTYQVLRITAKKASPGGGAERSDEFQFGDAPGTVSGGAASQQLCPVIILIPPTGIKTSGKIFLPCIAESQIAGNVVSAGWLSNVTAMVGSMMAGFAGSSITWDSCIHSRKNSNFVETADFSVSPIVGFQRRRQRAPL